MATTRRTNMTALLASGVLVAGALSQNSFEPADFNVTQALLDNGVDASVIPELATFPERSVNSGCSIACHTLKLIFDDDQVLSQSEVAYDSFVKSFWSTQQREIVPQCVFKPKTAVEVSTSILLSRLTQCPFAAKSGGHSAVPGGSNIKGGITIGFEKMNKIALSTDKKIASFQPGNTWYNIYTTLEKDNVAVLGGRVGSVGVGGLTLGGGISYFSSEHGLACDNVESYELVTASGIVLTVSQKSYPDLYWALRGGGNNFGLVTQFNVATIPRARQMWGGSRMYLPTEFPALIDAYVNLGTSANKDPKAHQILTFTGGENTLALTELDYSNPVANAPVLAEFNAIPNAILDQTAITSLANLTLLLAGLDGDAGVRKAFWTWTTKLDKEIASVTKDIFYEELAPILDAAGVKPSMSLQVLTEPIIEKTAARGGNALGLNPKDGPLMLGLVTVSWDNKADDERINQYAAKVVERSVAAAKAKGKDHPYMYMNYASPLQNPIAGYGAANQARLKTISKKYDPTGVFQKLQPGYFKL